MKKIAAYLRPYLGRMSLGLLIKFIGTIMDLLLPWILATTIDHVVPTKSIPAILLWGGMMVVCSVVALVANIVANRMASRVARDTTRRIRHDLFDKIVRLSCRQVDGFSVPSLEARLTSDTYNIHQMIGMMQRLGVRAPILLLGGVLVTLTLEPVLTLVLLAVLPLIGFVIWRISKKGIPLYGELQKAVDRLIRSVREKASGIRVIKALSKEAYEKERFAAVNQEVVDRETHAAVTMAASNPLMNLFLNLGLTLVIVAGAYRVNDGLTQPGTIIAFLTYFTIILNAMLSITRMFVLYSKGSASAGRIAQVLDTPEDLLLLPEDRRETGAHIAFEHVSFSYNKNRNALTDIHFSLARGETLGIIGATGSGKSTLAALLMRLYDPDQGVIRINGINVASLPPEELHTRFGVVFQNDFLMEDTIAGNISFGRGLSEEDIAAAAAYAQAESFIEELEDGYAHRLTARGTNLSGGQKQRVLIARALAARPEILILDDASSALDYRTDARLRRAVGEHFEQTTTIVVAQRVSSVRQADHILVLEEGRMLGFGTHEELMDSCASYREIAESQMGGMADAG
mgnify:CR=1 FL=1